MVNCPKCGSSFVSKYSDNYFCESCQTEFSVEFEFHGKDKHITTSTEDITIQNGYKRPKDNYELLDFVRDQNDFVINYLSKDKFDLNDSRDMKIDYIVRNFPLLKIEYGIVEAKDKLEHVDFLDGLDESMFNFLCNSFDIKEGNKQDKIYYLLFNDIGDIYLEMFRFESKQKDKVKISKLDDFVFNQICKYFEVSGDDKDEKINYLLQNYPQSDIEKQIDYAYEKLRFKDELASLEVFVFNYICKSLDVHSRYKKDKIDLLLENYSLPKIIREVNIGKKKLEFKESLENLDSLILDYICYKLEVPKKSKKDKIKFLLDNFSIKEIESEIKKGKIRITYKEKLSLLDDPIIYHLSKVFDVPYNNKRDQVDYLYYKVSLDSIKETANSAMKKYSLINDLNEDELKFLYNTLCIEEGSEIYEYENLKELYECIISNFSYNKIRCGKQLADKKLSFKDELNNLNDDEFEIIQDAYSLSDKSKDYCINFLLNNKSIREINRNFKKINAYNRLMETDELVFKLISDNLLFDASQNEKEANIKELINKYSLTGIYSEIRAANEKADICRELMKIDDLTFRFISDILLSDASQNVRESDVLTILKEYDSVKINSEIRIAKEKVKLYELLKNDEGLVQYLLYRFKIPKNLESKTEKLFYLIGRNVNIDIKSEISNFEDKNDEFKQLNSLNDQEFKALDKIDDILGDTKEEKIFNLISNKSKNNLNSLIEKIKENTKFINYLKNTDENVFKLVSNYFSVPEFSKDKKIDYLINEISKEEICKKINLFQDRFNYVNELDDDAFELLSKQFIISSKSNKEEIIIELLENKDFYLIKDKSSFISNNIEFYQYLYDLDEKIFNILFKELIAPYKKYANSNFSEKIHFIVKKYKFNDVKSKINEILEKLDYISDNLIDDNIYQNIFDEFNIAENLSKEEKIDYLNLNYPLDEIVEKIDHFISVSTFSGKIRYKFKNLFNRDEK